MNLLSDVITYIRRIIKSPSNTDISDALIIDYINRFWIMDVDARLQLFDLKTTYQFMTSPGVDRYNMPLYDVQSETPNMPGSQDIGMYPVYQGFLGPAYINGIRASFQTQEKLFYNSWPNIVQYSCVIEKGNGTSGPYTLTIPISPNFIPPLNTPINALLRGHIDITGIISTGVNVDPPVISSSDILTSVPFIQDMVTTSVLPAVYFTSTNTDGSNIIISDSGQFLEGAVNYGILMQPGSAPLGNLPLTNGPTPNYSITQNTINYFTGIATNVYFPVAIPQGANINAQCYYFQGGVPRGILYYNNTLTFRSPPAMAYLVQLEAYLTPCSFLNTSQAIPFAYMAEYIARGAARKIMSDTGDFEQFQFYEPLFLEQEHLVWKRSQRQWTANRTETLYSHGMNQNNGGYNNFGANNL
jgi:hypothetical protein